MKPTPFRPVMPGQQGISADWLNRLAEAIQSQALDGRGVASNGLGSQVIQPPTEHFFAQLYESAGSNPRRYAWAEVAMSEDGATYAVKEGGMFGSTDANFAVEFENRDVPEGTLVHIWFHRVGLYLFMAVAPKRSIDVVVGACFETELVECTVEATPPPNSVGTTQLQTGAVTSTNLATGAVDALAMAADAILTAAIADAQVTTPKVADGAITPDKLEPGMTWYGGTW